MKEVKEILNYVVDQYKHYHLMVRFWINQQDKYEEESPKWEECQEYICHYIETRMQSIRLYAFIKEISFEKAIEELGE